LFGTGLVLRGAVQPEQPKPDPRSTPDLKDLAIKSRAVLEKHCINCHKGPGSKGGDLDFRAPKALKVEGSEGKTILTPGKPDESYLYGRLAAGEMPPKAIKQRPSDEEKGLIKRWIEAGCPEPSADEEKPRPYITQVAMMTTIFQHLGAAAKEDRPYLRYLTLTNLANNRDVSNDLLRRYRAALSKALNSLSWKADIVLPKAIDKEQTVYAIDVRDLDWDRNNLWRAIMKAYPYGLRYNNVKDPALQKLDDDLSLLTDCEMPYVRADWFIATACRPPLYDTLLQLPANAKDLEKRLEVPVADNFRADKLARAGFIASGVSAQNRMVERHKALHGAYWKSYDFKPRNPRGDLTQLPLGPPEIAGTYANLAFQHDGGELIWNLPNGLQGYMLVKSNDDRIEVGPTDVVNDPQFFSGTPEIVAGLSCMGCHKVGMVNLPPDTLRANSAAQGEGYRKVLRLYPAQAGMDSYVQSDRERFLSALERAIGPYLRSAGDTTPIEALQGADPVCELAVRYHNNDLDPRAVACELDIDDPQKLLGMIQGNKRLRDLGMAPLLAPKGAGIKRETWEGTGGSSLLQRAARELEKGTPFQLIK
jgi:serine/threonine-protein kinase